jgi:two-component system, NarL family, sensor histidine kinase UhpB
MTLPNPATNLETDLTTGLETDLTTGLETEASQPPEASGLAGYLVLLSQTRGLAAIGQLIVRSAQNQTGAASVRLSLALDQRREVVAVANAVGVSSLSGEGFGFEADSPPESAISLEARGRQIGWLEVRGADPPEPEFLRVSALALEAARLARDAVRREREAKALSELSRGVSDTLDLEQILQDSLQHIVRALGLERGLLGLFSRAGDDGAEARTFFQFNFPQLQTNEVLSISPESFARLHRGQPIVLNDVQTSSRSFADTPRQLGSEAFLMLPIVARGQTLGVVYADTTRANQEITERSVALGTAMLEIAALAMDNARSYGLEQQKRQSAEALRGIMQRLSESLSISQTLEAILETAVRLLGANACAVFERVRQVLEPRASYGVEDEQILQQGTDILLESTVQQSVIVAQHLLAAPLMARGEVYGALALYFIDATPPQGEALETIAAFAAQAGVALGNARAFSDENALLELARVTSSTLELEEVLDLICREALALLDLERGFIGFFDVLDTENRRAEIGRLYAQNFPDDLEGFIKPFVIADEAFERLIVDLEPIVINDAQDESLENEGPTLLGAHAFVVAPIQVQGSLIGILYADSTKVSEITQRETRLASAIAQQAALAIQNARLFDRIQAAQQQYSLLAESATDLILSTDLEGRINYANNAALEVLGYAPSQMLEWSLFDLLEPNSLETAQSAWQTMRQIASTFTATVRRSDGSLATLEIKLSAQFLEGELQGGLVVARDLSEQQKLAQEIAVRGQAQAREGEMRTFLSLFTQASEEERRRIARELHDDTAQTLVAITRRLDRLETALATMPLDAAKERVRDIRSDVDAAIASVRRFSRNLRPSALDDLGLLPALEWLCSQSSTPARLEVQGLERRLASALELTIYRVVQEALTNIAKHAHASHCAVRVQYLDTSIEISVSDNGRGLEQQPDLLLGGHLGLAGMRERVALAGGSMSIENEAGTTLAFVFPT